MIALRMIMIRRCCSCVPGTAAWRRPVDVASARILALRGGRSRCRIHFEFALDRLDDLAIKIHLHRCAESGISPIRGVCLINVACSARFRSLTQLNKLTTNVFIVACGSVLTSCNHESQRRHSLFENSGEGVSSHDNQPVFCNQALLANSLASRVNVTARFIHSPSCRQSPTVARFVFGVLSSYCLQNSSFSCFR